MSLTLSLVPSLTSRHDDRKGGLTTWRRAPEPSSLNGADASSAVPRIVPRPVMVAGQTGGAIAILTLGRFAS